MSGFTPNNSMMSQIRRAAQAGFLTDICTIVRPSADLMQDEYGSPMEGETVVASDVACRVITAGKPNNPAMMVVADQESMKDSYRLAVPNGTDIAAGDRAIVGSITYSVMRMATELTDEVFEMAIIEYWRGADNG